MLIKWQPLASFQAHIGILASDDGIVVHNQRTQSLFAFTGPTAGAFLEFEAAISDNPESLEGRSALPAPVLAQFRRAISGGIAIGMQRYPSGPAYRQKPARMFGTAGNAIAVRAIGRTFAIHATGPQQAGSIAAHFATIAAPRVGHIDHHVEIGRRIGAGAPVFVNRARCPGIIRAPSMLIPMLHALVRGVAYRQQDYLLALHSAALYRDGRCLLLPGLPGAGKSTLCAALMARGYRLLTDETSVLLPGPARIASIPIPVALKPGSWGALRGIYPNLAREPIFKRADGIRVRYLRAPADTPLDDRAATHLLFPSYKPGGRATIRPVGVIEALARLFGGGYGVNRELSPAKVRRILDWSAALRCYAIEYPDSGSAIDLVREAL